MAMRFRGCGRENGDCFSYCLNCNYLHDGAKCKELRVRNNFVIQNRSDESEH